MAVSVRCTCSKTRVSKGAPPTNENDRMLGFIRQGLCPCGKTKLQRKNYGPGWTPIPGAVCSDCPGSICRRSLETANNLLKKKIYKTALKLIGHFSMGNHFRRKTNNVILLKDQVAAELATTEEKLATAEEKLAEEQQKNHDLKEKYSDATDRSYSNIILAAKFKALLQLERQKNDELGKKLVATQKIAFEHAVFTAEFKDCMREVALDVIKNPLCLFWGKDSITDTMIKTVKYWKGDEGHPGRVLVS